MPRCFNTLFYTASNNNVHFIGFNTDQCTCVLWCSNTSAMVVLDEVLHPCLVVSKLTLLPLTLLKSLIHHISCRKLIPYVSKTTLSKVVSLRLTSALARNLVLSLYNMLDEKDQVCVWSSNGFTPADLCLQEAPTTLCCKNLLVFFISVVKNLLWM